MKGAFIIGFAIFIDALQALFAVIFTVLQFFTPAGGGAVGAFAAGYYCWSTASGILAGIKSAAACSTAGGIVGAGVSAFSIPIGAAVDVFISLTLGTALIAVLAFSGMFSIGSVMGGFLTESIPFLDALIPGWTLMAWRCVHNKKVEERSRAQQATHEEVPVPATTPRVFDGIRAANDNIPYEQATA